ncbi:hypothetical protein TMatcc_001129 [Talaromyces marneffei ATCC 18224]|uniref:Uncharacterized protein n=1 Tax=Talaromyces marneffei PM1 TaxID=1077442 RepID=A0A093V4S2_TALMA
MLFRTSTNTTTKCADQNQQASKPVAQNTTKNYLYRPALQALLEKLFPDQTDFSIEMRDDQWHFVAPRAIGDDELE